MHLQVLKSSNISGKGLRGFINREITFICIHNSKYSVALTLLVGTSVGKDMK